MSVDRPAAEQAILAFLRALGRDPALEPELQGTPARVVAAYVDELCNGYGTEPSAVVRPHVVEGSTAIVVLRDIPVTTMCPHHLMPASGLGTVAFAPHRKLVGLGVMATLLDVCAHRLILQEEIGERVVAALAEELGAHWVACRLVLSHGCVSARGERKHGAMAETFAFVGDASGRAEAIAVVAGQP
jgi:GTP cyclohydrolase I